MQSSCYHGFFEAGITGFSWCVKTVKSQAAVKSQEGAVKEQSRGLKKALSKLDLTVLRTRAIIRQPAQELKQQRKREKVITV